MLDKYAVQQFQHAVHYIKGANSRTAHLNIVDRKSNLNKILDFLVYVSKLKQFSLNVLHTCLISYKSFFKHYVCRIIK